MYRIIACDLDETLLNSDHQVSDKDIETIARLGQMGVKFVLATGRGYRHSVVNVEVSDGLVINPARTSIGKFIRIREVGIMRTRSCSAPPEHSALSTRGSTTQAYDVFVILMPLHSSVFSSTATPGVEI